MTTIATLAVKLVGDIGDLTKSLGEAEHATSSFASKIEGIAKTAAVGFAAVGTAAIGAGAALLKIGSDFDDAVDKIRVGTGATGEALAGLERDFKAVFTAIPTDMESASTAVADLNTRLGLTGEPLQQLSKQFIELSRITGTDLSSNIATVTRAFGDWGIATDDQSAALDTLFKVSQATGPSVDRIGQLVVQYGAPLRQFGFSFEEAAALMGKFEKEGVNTELVMGSLRIAIGHFAEENIPLRKGLEETIAKIQALGPGAEATALAMEVFGARAGPDMAAAILEGKFAIDDLVAAIEGSGETILKAGQDTADFGEKWTVLKNKMLTAVEPLATRVMGVVTDFVTLLADKVFPAVETLGQLFGAALRGDFMNAHDIFMKLPEPLHGIGQAVWELGSFIREQALPALKEFGGFIRDTVVPALKDFIQNDVAPKVQALVSALASLWPVPLQDIGNFLKNEILPRLQDLGSWMADHKEIIGAIGIAFATWKLGMIALDIAKFVAQLPGMIAGLQAMSAALLTPPLGLVAAIAALAAIAFVLWQNWDEIWPKLKGLWEDLKTKITEVVTGLKDWLLEHWEQIVTGILAVVFPPGAGLFLLITHWDEVKTKVLEITDALRDLAVEKVTAFKDLVLEQFDRLRDFAVEKATALKDKVLESLGSLVQGIKDKAGDFTEAATQVFDIGFFRQGITFIWANVIEPWLTGLGSRILNTIGNLGSLLVDTGKSIIQGLIQGISDKFSDVASKLGELKSFIPQWKGPPSEDLKLLEENGRLIIQGLVNGIESMLPAVRNALVNMGQRIIDGLRAGGFTEQQAFDMTVAWLFKIFDALKNSGASLEVLTAFSDLANNITRFFRDGLDVEGATEAVTHFMQELVIALGSGGEQAAKVVRDALSEGLIKIAQAPEVVEAGKATAQQVLDSLGTAIATDTGSKVSEGTKKLLDMIPKEQQQAAWASGVALQFEWMKGWRAGTESGQPFINSLVVWSITTATTSARPYAQQGGMQSGLVFAESVAMGIQQSTGSVIAAAVNMVLQAIAAARAAAESSSPSKVFKEIGLSFPQGAAAGIRLGTPLVASAAAGMTRAAIAAASGPVLAKPPGMPVPGGWMGTTGQASAGSSGITINGDLNLEFPNVRSEADARGIVEEVIRELGRRTDGVFRSLRSRGDVT